MLSFSINVRCNAVHCQSTLLDRLRIAPVLKGVRGEASMDVEALCDALLALGRLMGDVHDIDSVDLNPVIVYDAGQGCLAVDAVVVRCAGRR